MALVLDSETRRASDASADALSTWLCWVIVCAASVACYLLFAQAFTAVAG